MVGMDRLAKYIAETVAENANLKRQKQMLVGTVKGDGVRINGKTYASHQAAEMKLIEGSSVICAFIGSSKKVAVLGQ